MDHSMTYDELVNEIRHLLLEHDVAIEQARQIWHPVSENTMPARVSDHCSRTVLVTQGGIYSTGFYDYRWHEWVVQSSHIDAPEAWMDFKRYKDG